MFDRCRWVPLFRTLHCFSDTASHNYKTPRHNVDHFASPPCLSFRLTAGFFFEPQGLHPCATPLPKPPPLIFSHRAVRGRSRRFPPYCPLLFVSFSLTFFENPESYITSLPKMPSHIVSFLTLPPSVPSSVMPVHFAKLIIFFAPRPKQVLNFFHPRLPPPAPAASSKTLVSREQR